MPWRLSQSASRGRGHGIMGFSCYSTRCGAAGDASAGLRNLTRGRLKCMQAAWRAFRCSKYFSTCFWEFLQALIRVLPDSELIRRAPSYNT